MSPIGRVTLKGIAFEAPNTWSFHPFTGQILGRPDSHAGVMQISSAYRRDVVGRADHRASARIASKWAGIGDDSPPLSDARDGVLFGEMSGRVENEFKRVWYLVRDGELLIGAFACSWEDRDSRAATQALAEMAELMRTARYAAES